MMKAIVYLICISLLIFTACVCRAEIAEEKMDAITEAIQARLPQWKKNDTEILLEKARHSGEVSYVSRQGNGETVRIKVIGETILLDGEDISGKLGNKVTYGDNSPIIGPTKNSDFTTGQNSPLIKTSLYIDLYIEMAKIGFPICFILNIVFILIARKKNLLSLQTK